MSKYNIWKRTIAAVVVCLFLANQLAWAYPDALATQGLSDPKIREEVLKKLSDERYDAHEGKRLAMTGAEVEALPETIAGLPVIPATCPKEKRKARIAAVQLKNAGFQDNTGRMVNIVSELAELGKEAPDLILFPELLDLDASPSPQDVKTRQQQITDIVAKYGIAVGYCLRQEEEESSIHYHVVKPADGSEEPKPQIFEKEAFTKENRKIHIKEGCDAGLFICSEMNSITAEDADRQERAACLRNIKGSSVVLIPSSVIPRGGRHWAQKAFNRFGLPVLVSNVTTTGRGAFEYGSGRSFFIGNNGQIIKVPKKHEEAILIADVTTDEAKPGLKARPAMDVFLEEHFERGQIYSLKKDKIPNTDNVIDKRRMEMRVSLGKAFGPIKKDGQSLLDYVESMPVICDGKEEAGMEFQICIAGHSDANSAYDESYDPLPFDMDNPGQAARAHVSGGRLTIIYTWEELLRNEVLVTVNGETFPVSCACFAVVMAAHELDSRSDEGEKAVDGLTREEALAALRQAEIGRTKMQNAILRSREPIIPQVYHEHLASLHFKPKFPRKGRDYAAEEKKKPSIGAIEDASRRYLSGEARWRDYKIEVPPEYYVIPHSEVLDKYDNFDDQYEYLREQVAVAKKLGLIPLLATPQHHPSAPLAKAVRELIAPQAKVVCFDKHSDVYANYDHPNFPMFRNSHFWCYAFEKGIISGQDLILASREIYAYLKRFLKGGIKLEELIQLAHSVSLEDLSHNRFPSVKPAPDTLLGKLIDHPDATRLLYLLKRGVILANPSGGNSALLDNSPKVVSYDVDSNLTRRELKANAKDLIGQEVAAMHICEHTIEGFTFRPQAVSRFLADIAAGTHSRSFVQDLRDAAPEAQEDEELIVAFDTDIGNIGEHNGSLYTALSEVHGKKGLENLNIVTGSGSLDLNAKLSAQVAKAGKKTRVVIIARQANIDKKTFSAFESTARIVAVNDNRLITEDGVYDISVTHIIEDVLRDETISLIDFLEPEDSKPIPTTELERRSRERARFLRAA